MNETEVHYGSAPSPYGGVVIAWTVKGLAFLAFADSVEERREAGMELSRRYSPACLIENPDLAEQWTRTVFGHDNPGLIPVDPVGTPFQLRVWEELRKIPNGEVISYRQLAERLGRPKSVRAVASAIGANPIACVIPCHRVVRSDGKLGGFRWGEELKRKLLAVEARPLIKAVPHIA